jgi:hypothetical protein
MQSILDYSRAPDATNSAAIDPVFNITQITNEAGQVDYPWFWTGTTHLKSNGSTSNAVYITFGRGLGSMDNVNVIDVHGAGCQRSDPKTGSANDYPTWGNGPQGDVRRVFNYVRLVRDGAAQFVEGAGSGADASTQLAANNQPSGGQPPVGNGPPQEAVNACSGLSENSTCQFTTPRGEVSGTCRSIAGQLACAPEGGPPSQ